jgi:hypothetical protein
VKQETFAKTTAFLKFCLPARLGGLWIALVALVMFSGSYVWRNYFGGEQDAVFFQLLSLVGLWCIYGFGVVSTLYRLRVNSSSFLVDDIKKLSFGFGLCASLIIHCASFLFCSQFGTKGLFVFLLVFHPICVLLFGPRINRWLDVARLNITGLFPFLLLGGYLLFVETFSVSVVWLWLLIIACTILIGTIFYSLYIRWIRDPRNSTSLDLVYKSAKKYYTSTRGFDS